MSTQGETKSQLSCIKRIHSFRKNGGRDVATPLYVIASWTGDRSGSMTNISRTSGIGLYDWLKDITASATEHNQEGKIFVTTFSDESTSNVAGTPIKQVQQEIIENKITQDTCISWMEADGMTKLYDTAIAELKNIVEERDRMYDALPRQVKLLDPEISMVWACCTDGFDNKSTATITEFKQTVLWARSKGVKCFFLAANQDAEAVGQSYGFERDMSMTYTPDDYTAGYALRSVTQVMRQATTGSEDFHFTEVMRTQSCPVDNVFNTPRNSPVMAQMPYWGILRQPAVNSQSVDVDPDDAGYSEDDEGYGDDDNSEQTFQLPPPPPPVARQTNSTFGSGIFSAAHAAIMSALW